MSAIQQMLMAMGGIPVPSISWRTSNSSGTDASSYTFSAQDIGTAGSNRHVILGIMSLDSALGVTGISSVTIGGVSATTQVAINVVGTGSFSALTIAAVPSGATGDIVVNMTTTQARLAIGVWAAYDLVSPTAVASATSSADPAVLNLNTQIGDIVVACGFNNTGSTASWTGATERFDTTVEGANYTGADHTATSAETPRTISLDWSSADRRSAVSAVWR